MATTKARRDAFRFFHEQAGYVVGRRAEGALRLARAEELLAEAVDLEVAAIRWEDDDDLPYEHGILSDEEISERFDSGEWVGPFYCVVTIGDEHVASLGGIVVGSAGLADPYCRVVAAELASELVDELRRAIDRERAARLVVRRTDEYDEETLLGRFDLYGALYVFCTEWHSGASSRGYRILSRLSRVGYSPGLGLQRGEFESEDQRDIYEELTSRYAEKV